jgi:hypothetical protein
LENHSRRFASDVNRARSQGDEVLRRLRLAGSRGCRNTELWDICHAVNSRIADLRNRGHQIHATCEGRGVWRYRLIETESLSPDPSSPQPTPAGSAAPHPVTLRLFAGVPE